MHKFLVNRIALTLDLRPRSAFLVKEGDKARALVYADEADLQPIRTGASGERTVFIPGSSLKGAFRAAAERSLRSLPAHRTSLLACDPLDPRGACHVAGKGRDREHRPSSAQIHAAQCLACRTFGSQQIAGRVRFADALPADPKSLARANRVEHRACVAIDRRTGAASGGKLFEMEVVTGGSFRADVHLHNAQLWQVGLVAGLVDELDAGLLRIGGGATRGLGAMDVSLVRLTWWQTGHHGRPGGAAALRVLEDAYGWLPDGFLDGDDLQPDRPARGGQEWVWEGDRRVRATLTRTADAGWTTLENWAAQEPA